MTLIKKLTAIICLILMASLSQPKVIHVYHDKASTPALLQMINYINQKESDIKIVTWDRFHAHIKDKFKNTFFINNLDEIFTKIDSLKQKYKRITLVIHYNIHHPFLFDDLYSKFEKDIKVVHIYEDASTYMWWQTNADWLLLKQDKFKKNLHMWGDIKKLCTEPNPLSRCEAIRAIQNHVRIVPVDFHQLKKTLSEKDKKIIFQLAGFDYSKYKDMLSKKPNGIYVLGVALEHPFEASQLAALKDVCQSTPNYTWFYKPHPNYAYIPTQKVLTHYCPNIKQLDTYIPFELLILGNLSPNKVAGASSSLFANQQKEIILSYIQRGENDIYIDILNKANILQQNQIYTFEKIKQKFKELDIIRIENSWPHSYWLIRTNDSTVCKMTENLCGNIIEETDTAKTIQFYNGYLLKINHKKEYIWEEIPLTKGDI